MCVCWLLMAHVRCVQHQSVLKFCNSKNRAVGKLEAEREASPRLQRLLAKLRSEQMTQTHQQFLTDSHSIEVGMLGRCT